jgi:arylsulfatase A-like enzyme
MRWNLNVIAIFIVLAMIGRCYATDNGPLLVPTDRESLTATRTVNDNKVIPAPTLPFGGVIGKIVSDSKAWWPPQIVAPKKAPNILLVIIDDEGFGAPSTFGGLIPTPELDKLAKEGLRYNNFHTTALCSPTRAALITGRNHGTVGYEMIAELATGFPGYDAIMGKQHATVARILQANGYATAWFGKDHNVPGFQATAAGPFDQWPVGQGFDYFYGFIGGDMDQWNPTLYENTTLIFPSQGHPGYNLNVDLADKAIAWLNRVNDLKPEQPVFLYYAPGATHAPHQPTPEWIAKFKGKFHDGWNAYRELTFKRQKEMGIIPKAAKLTPWPDKLLPKWDSLSPVEKQVYEKQMEVYAAYLAQTDYEIGRVIQAFRDTGRYNNTLIIYICGDNGASTEGGLTGTPSEVQSLGNATFLTPEQMLKYLPEWGGPKTDPHFAAPWAWALDTPFKWTKQVASFFGGTKNGMVISWPGHINDAGAIRQQFHHVIDVVPTILAATGITEPEIVDGVKQEPIQGVSFDYTFDKANTNAPSTHHTQYFEMFGARAIYNDGWIAATDPFGAPWLTFANKPVKDPWNTAVWHLYHVTPDSDWTENDDLKDKYPDKLKELQALFEVEAKKNNVLPLNAMPSFLDARPSLLGARKTIVYHEGIVGLLFADSPMILNRSYRIDGDITVPRGGANGVIVADGGTFGGYSLFLKDGKPCFSYNLIMLDTIRWHGKDVVTPGHHTISFDFKYDGGGYGKGGVGTLLVDGKAVDSHRIEKTVPFTMPWFEGMDIGMDMLTPVDSEYETPFAFNGKIDKVTFHLEPFQLTAQQINTWRSVLATAAAGIQ